MPWGPSPGVPPPQGDHAGEPKEYASPQKILLVLMFFGGVFALAAEHLAVGLVLTVVPLLCALMPVLRSRERRENGVVAKRIRLLRTPERVVASDADPLSAAQALTARDSGGVFLGVSPDRREWVVAEQQQAVLVLGPPRSGKTSSLIIPTLLAAQGPAVSTSTKADVLRATANSRSRAGRIWLFDPSGTEVVPPGVLELHWSPVHSASTWDGARALADAMVDASASGKGVEDASYWTESAKALLGPLLHAAALNGNTVADVRRWVSRRWVDGPLTTLEEHGAEAAADDLFAIHGTEERERSSIFSTTRLVLGAYGSDAVAVRSQYQNFDADRFVRSADTVYITAPSHLQSVTAPLVVGLLEEIRQATYKFARTRDHGAPSPPPVLWALDEVANIAPIRKLPAIVSEAGGQGLQIMACLQDLSQARVRWGPASDGFLSLFGTKVVFAGIADKTTLESLSTLVGDWDRPYTAISVTTGRSTQFGLPLSVSTSSHTGVTMNRNVQREAVLTAGTIANIPDGHALTVRASRWGLVETTPFFRAKPWQAVLRNAPSTIVDHGGTDELVMRSNRSSPAESTVDERRET